MSPYSVVTEGPETRQHRDAARHRPHGQVAHTGLRVPGERTRRLPASSLFAGHDSRFCSACSDAKVNKCVPCIMIIHDPPAESRTMTQGHKQLNCCGGCMTLSLLSLLSVSLPPGQRPQAVHGRLWEHPEHAECQGEPLQAVCRPSQLLPLSASVLCDAVSVPPGGGVQTGSRLSP